MGEYVYLHRKNSTSKLAVSLKVCRSSSNNLCGRNMKSQLRYEEINRRLVLD